MNRERIIWIVIVGLFLVAGFLIGRHPSFSVERADADSFRQWFWENRGLDLLAQAGLILVGALGIAALLPRGRERQ